MSQVEITPEGWAVLEDDHISCSQDVRINRRIDFDVFGSIDLCRHYWKEGATVIDIGANIGCWSVPMARTIGPSGRLIAFEPDPGPYYCLTRNLERYPQSPSDIVNAAVWKETGTVRFFRNPSNRGASAINPNGQQAGGNEEFIVAAVRLDDLHLSHISFIKIDVEGAELACLQGAERLITDQHPVLFIETVESGQVAFG